MSTEIEPGSSARDERSKPKTAWNIMKVDMSASQQRGGAHRDERATDEERKGNEVDDAGRE